MKRHSPLACAWLLALLGRALPAAAAESATPPPIGWVLFAGAQAKADAALNQWSDHAVWVVPKAAGPGHPRAAKVFELPGTEMIGEACGAQWFASPVRGNKGAHSAVLWEWRWDSAELKAHEVAVSGEAPLRPGPGDTLVHPCGYIVEENGKPVWYAAYPAGTAMDEWPGRRADLTGDGPAEAKPFDGAPALPQVLDGWDAADNGRGRSVPDRYFHFAARLGEDGRLREVVCHSLFKMAPKPCPLPAPCDLSEYRRRDGRLEVWACCSDLSAGAPLLVLAAGRHPSDNPAKDDVRPLGYHLWSAEGRAWTRVDPGLVNGGKFLDYPFQMYAKDGRMVLELPPPVSAKPGAIRYRLLDVRGIVSAPMDLDAHLQPLRAFSNGLLFAEGGELVFHGVSGRRSVLATLPAGLACLRVRTGVADTASLNKDRALAGVPEALRGQVVWCWGEKGAGE